MEASAAMFLREGALRLGIPLVGEAPARFAKYVDMLGLWNRRIKLTTVTQDRDVVDRHFLDSLAVAPTLRAFDEVVDVGSGAGFPGVPLAIVLPGVRVTVVESIQKKAAFLEALKRELGLGNLTVEARRMEDLVREGRLFGGAVSRATLAPPEWLRLGRQLVAPRGCLVAMVVPGEGVTAEGLAPWWPQWFDDANLQAPYAPGRALVVLRGRRG